MKAQTKSRLIKLSVVVVLLLAIALYLFGFRLKAADVKNYRNVRPFTEEGFLDVMEYGLNDENKLVAENERFELYFNEINSHFRLRDKLTSEVIQSNPGVEDIRPNELIGAKSATMELGYVDDRGSVKNINNYGYSIYHEGSNLVEEGHRTFSVKYIDGGFQVLYHVKKQDINFLYFPKYITREKFATFSENHQTILRTFYRVQDDLYQLSDSEYTSMKGGLRQTLYDVFYDENKESRYGYTEESIIEENEFYGFYDNKLDDPEFYIAVEVKLTDTGFETTILKDSIIELGRYRLTHLTIYPYLGAAVSEIDSVPTNGYLVVPDGSGAVIEFKPLTRSNIRPYNERIYGRDLSLLPFEKPEDKEMLSIPLFGMVKDNIGFAGIIKEGDTQASIRADVAGRDDDYYKVYPSYLLRENEIALIGTNYRPKEMNLWTKDIAPTDLVVEYVILAGEKNNYAGIAEAYRNYLIAEYNLEKLDLSSNPVVTLELLGAYDKKAYFIGVPYNQIKSLTTFKEAEEIMTELNNENIDLNVLFKGATNGGLKSSIQTRLKFESVLGGKKDYKHLQKTAEELNANLYLQVAISQASKYRRFTDKYTYSSQRLNGDHAKVHTYHLPTGLVYDLTGYNHSEDDFIISPKYYQSTFNKLEPQLLNSNINFVNVGNRLAGNYNKRAPIYRVDAINIQKEFLYGVNQKMMLTNPLGFAYASADYITDLPLSSTLYPIISYGIPLVQLVLSGYVDYTSKSINLMLTRNVDYNFLRILETGSNLKYTLTYENPNKLIDTEYNMYLSTYYQDWKDTLIEHYNELKQIGLHKYNLVGHERIQNNVFKVSYGDSINSVKLQIYINYDLRDVVVEGMTVKSLGYKVVSKE